MSLTFRMVLVTSFTTKTERVSRFARVQKLGRVIAKRVKVLRS